VNATARGISLVVALSAVGAAAIALDGRSAQAEVAAKKKIDPEADRLLRQMTDTLAGLKSFKVRSSAVDEVVTTGGQKIQILSESDVSVQRPNRLRSEQVGTDSGLAFWYDGQNMTLECKGTKTFVTAPAPNNLDDAIDKARKDFQIEAPGADLLYSRPYEILTEQVTGGKVIGKETVNGLAANHLAFQGEDVDFQLWIQDGPKPLPLRFVITSKKVKGTPEFTVEMSQWQPDAIISGSTFVFQPPAGANKVQSLPSTCGGRGAGR
jgi:hypothetical protein